MIVGMFCAFYLQNIPFLANSQVRYAVLASLSATDNEELKSTMESNTKPQQNPLVRYLPILGWLPKYERSWLRADLIAGLTVVVLLIPEGMAYAQIAGMPPQTAFYAAPIGLLAFAIFGTSRQLVVAVSAIIATMSFATVSLISAPFSLVGGVVGILFMLSLQRLQKLFQPMKQHVVLRGLLGGLGMGIIGALLPLTLFSGEKETGFLITNAAEIGVAMLIVLAVCKLLATSLLLATGWKGGYIFPIMFAGVALGLAMDLLFPGIPVAVTVAATMTGVFVAALKAPLFAALFTMALVQVETAPVIAVAVVVSALMTALLALRTHRRAENQAEAT